MSGWREETIGDARLILGDCREVLPTLGKVDAVVTDPPYGIGYVHGGRRGKLARGVSIIGDDAPFDPSSFLGFSRVVLFGANHFADKLPASANWLIWDKRDGVCRNDQADCEMAWTNLKGPARLIRHLWSGVLKDSERGEIRVHPTQKPIAVMQWVIEQATDTTHTILDPFMGSGTTGVACAKLGREFIGIEIDASYFAIACRRIDDAYKQPRLFADAAPKPVQLILDGAA